MQPRKPTPLSPAGGIAPERARVVSAVSENSRTGDDAAAQQAIEEAEYQAFLAFQDTGARNSKRALGGRRATR
jgi:hypothetical protein